MDSTEPKIWGPVYWYVMKQIAKTYTNENEAIAFFNALAELLPCLECRMHYKQLLTKFPIPVGSRELIVTWVDKIQTEIKTATQQPSAIIPPRIQPKNIRGGPIKFTRLVNGSVRTQPSLKAQQPALTLNQRSGPPVKRGGCGCHKKKFY